MSQQSLASSQSPTLHSAFSGVSLTPSLKKDEDVEAIEDDTEVQAGVMNMEAISKMWTKWSLIAAYVSIFLMAFTTSLESQVSQSLSIFATSSFAQHSLISTVYVVQNVVNAVVKPPMAKIADVFGRLEAFSFSVLLLVLGYIQMAASSNVQSFAAAQIFYSAGATGLQILQQIFIADTSDLLNRALLSCLPCIPFIVTVWIGCIIGGLVLKGASWRWGYGMWSIILPAMFMPLVFILFLNNRRAKKRGLTTPSPLKGLSFKQGVRNLWLELDLGGIVLLTAAFSLILLPLTVASKTVNGWRSPSIISMLGLGLICFITFPIWEFNEKLAPKPLLPMKLLKSRTFCAACGIGFFYFMSFYLSVQPYFYTYLLVARHQSVSSAGHIVQAFSFTAAIASILTSLLIKYSKLCKPFACIGVVIYILGLSLMICFNRSATVAQTVGSQIFVGIGGGIFYIATQLCVQAGSDHQNVGVATAIFITCAELGGAVGAAISGAIWSRTIPMKLEEYLPAASKENATMIANDINKAIRFRVGGAERIAIDRAYQETMRMLLVLAICVAVPLVPLSFVMKNYKLSDIEQSVKGKVVDGRPDDTSNEKEGSDA